MTKTVNIDEAKTTLLKLLSLVSSGNEAIIAKDDKPIAKIIPISPPIRVRVAGLNMGINKYKYGYHYQKKRSNISI